jgi:hypothetical protein
MATTAMGIVPDPKAKGQKAYALRLGSDRRGGGGDQLDRAACVGPWPSRAAVSGYPTRSATGCTCSGPKRPRRPSWPCHPTTPHFSSALSRMSISGRRAPASIVV